MHLGHQCCHEQYIMNKDLTTLAAIVPVLVN